MIPILPRAAGRDHTAASAPIGALPSGGCLGSVAPGRPHSSREPRSESRAAPVTCTAHQPWPAPPRCAASRTSSGHVAPHERAKSQVVPYVPAAAGKAMTGSAGHAVGQPISPVLVRKRGWPARQPARPAGPVHGDGTAQAIGR